MSLVESREREPGVTERLLEEVPRINPELRGCFNRVPGCLVLSWVVAFGWFVARATKPEEDDALMVAFREAIKSRRREMREPGDEEL